MTLRRQEQNVRTTAAALTTSPSMAQADALGELNLIGIEPGDYVLGLSVTLPDGSTLTRDVALQVR